VKDYVTDQANRCGPAGDEGNQTCVAETLCSATHLDRCGDCASALDLLRTCLLHAAHPLLIRRGLANLFWHPAALLLAFMNGWADDLSQCAQADTGGGSRCARPQDYDVVTPWQRSYRLYQSGRSG